jgi:XTP/dITP diphosphohydrolase
MIFIANRFYQPINFFKITFVSLILEMKKEYAEEKMAVICFFCIALKQKKMKLVFASNNAHKIAEIQAMLPQSIELVGLQDIGCTEDIPETALTLEGNAQLKADYVTENYGLPCFADDTGLEVEALKGAPGVYSARYAGVQKNAEDNMQKLLTELEGKVNRKAQFKTIIALNIDGKSYQFSGIVQGEIIEEKRGIQGFGYDPIFVPEGFTLTFAEMNQDEKARLSHRGKAVVQLIAFLTNK